MDAIKLKDIADQLGVSISTVSRAMSGKGRVGAGTRARILAACREADYTPNALARSLRLRDAKNVGVIVPDIANTYYATVIKGAENVCREHGYTLMVCNSDENPAFELDALKTMLEKQVSGLILASVGDSSGMFAHYQKLNLPIVCFDNAPSMPDDMEPVDFVSIDNRAAAYRLTRALISRGYRDVGMITGPMRQSTGYLRYAGFAEAMREADLPIREEWVVEGDFKMSSGKDAMRRILALPERPNAILVSNNDMAYGAIGALRDAKIRIPEDVAVASFDAIDETGMITPKITCINQPAEAIGRQCARIIMERIAGSAELARPLSIVQTPVFINGDSW